VPEGYPVVEVVFRLQGSPNATCANKQYTFVLLLQVNLVLEFCDWGCLRDTLDAGAFFSAGSLNYAAILDTAADVAKAMLHLHCNQVGCIITWWVLVGLCLGFRVQG
jgi:hypothetical protein